MMRDVPSPDLCAMPRLRWWTRGSHQADGVAPATAGTFRRHLRLEQGRSAGGTARPRPKTPAPTIGMTARSLNTFQDVAAMTGNAAGATDDLDRIVNQNALGHVDKWRSQSLMQATSTKPRKLSAVLS